MKVEGVIRFTGIMVLLTAYVTMILTFAAAYLNDYQILVTINTYGEAHIEAAMLLLTIPTVAWYVYILAKDTKSCRSA